jgi:hypothetical protein
MKTTHVSHAYGPHVNAPAGQGTGLRLLVLRISESTDRKHEPVNVKDFLLRVFSNINEYEVWP